MNSLINKIELILDNKTTTNEEKIKYIRDLIEYSNLVTQLKEEKLK